MNFICPTCGGIFDIPGMHLGQKLPPVSTCLESYKEFFGLNPKNSFISLGEGGTPLIQDLSRGQKIYHKMESYNPSGSYKDRGSVVLINYLKEYGHKHIVEDSSGNAGASLAAYAARSGIKASIFIPESASGPKKWQIEAYGALVVSVPGPRQNSAEAVRKSVSSGIVYASHAYLPLGMLGIATIAFEIYQQLGTSRMTLISPVGHGGLLLGIIRGFLALKTANIIQELPFFIGVQSEFCSPIADIYDHKPTNLKGDQKTIAEGIQVTKPVRGEAILSFLEHNNGMIIRVPEAEIIPATRELALKGMHVEPTSAVTWAALKHMKKDIFEPIVLIQTGAGLKTLQR